jgi:hypothetical protein
VTAQLLEAVQTDDLLLTSMLLNSGADTNVRQPETNYSLARLAVRAHQPLQQELLALNQIVLTEEEATSEAPNLVLAPEAPPPTYLEGNLRLFDTRSGSFVPFLAVFDMGQLILTRQASDSPGRRPSADAGPGDLDLALETMQSAEAAEAAALNTSLASTATLANAPTLETADFEACFRIITYSGREFVLSAPSLSVRSDWVKTLTRNIAALPEHDHGFDFDNCSLDGELQVLLQDGFGYRKRRYALQGKVLYYFADMQDQQKLGELDLRNVTDIFDGVVRVWRRPKGVSLHMLTLS